MTLADVYSRDKLTYRVAIAMQMNGFLFDVEAAKAQREKLIGLENQARRKLEEAVGRPLRTTPLGGVSTADLHKAVFKEMKVPVLFRSGKTKVPCMNIDAMRAYAASARPEVSAFAIAELERRRARKLRSTYIDKTLAKLSPEGRVYVPWKSFGTVSGRWSSKLQQLPRKTNDPTIIWENGKVASGGIRSLYIAPPGYKIVSFDCKQLELRIAAYISGDPYMLEACAASDMHAATAELVWGEVFRQGNEKLKYELRQIAKNFGFAVCYLAEAGTVYANIIQNGQAADFQVVEAAIRELRRRFKVYFRWQHERLLEIIKSGYAYSPLWGRRRWLSHTPRPTEAANFHVQAGAADVVNSKLPVIMREIAAREIDAKLVASVHDSCSAEVLEAHVSQYVALCLEVFGEPVEFTSSGASLQAKFPIDISIGGTWS